MTTAPRATTTTGITTAAVPVSDADRDSLWAIAPDSSDDDDNGEDGEDEPSGTARAIEELQTYGYRAFEDEPDPRPLPTGRQIVRGVCEAVDSIASIFEDTRLEPDLEHLLHGLVTAFQRSLERVERRLDDNETAQRRSQREQDGSEVKSVDLERLLAEGRSLLEARQVFEIARDHMANSFAARTGHTWQPRRGSVASTTGITATVLDSRDFIAARRKAEQEARLPAGPRIAIAGGTDIVDVDTVWAALDKVRNRHPDMVLLHGGADKGVDPIASSWARHRGIAQIVFKPDFGRHQRSAPFKRNDEILASGPVGLIALPGAGVVANLVDKARARKIPVWSITPKTAQPAR